MFKLKGACVVGQSGGPTAVINASILGVIKEAFKSSLITDVYGAANGIEGILNERLYDLSKETECELDLLKYTPSAALGSCRYKLKDYNVDSTDYERILHIFKKYNIRYFFYAGGNDSMDTCNKIHNYFNENTYECMVIGIPKTIDNDLTCTDHCPGYGSASKYIATTCLELSMDLNAYQNGSMVIVEIMGRNAGWLTASAALSTNYGDGPDLIYLPEVEFSYEKLYQDALNIYKQKKRCFIAVSEGVKDKCGTFISQTVTSKTAVDAFGHVQMGGVSSILASHLHKNTGIKTRGIELSLLQRCASHWASLTDIKEAYMAGSHAVRYATHGASGFMVGFIRNTNNSIYECNTTLFKLDQIANQEKKFPIEWYNKETATISNDFIEYVKPLVKGNANLGDVDGLPKFARLKKIKVTT